MNRFFRIAAAALIGAGFATAASAEDLRPRLVGSGENLSVEYPVPSANIVGGAIYAPADGSGQGESLQPVSVARSQSGRIATVVGTGENLSVIYQDAAPTTIRLAQGGFGG